MLQLRGGRAIELVVEHLESLDYRWAYRVLDSRAFGLPQRRRRVFLLASNVADPCNVLLSPDLGPPPENALASDVACGFYWTEGNRGLGWAVDAIPTLKGGSGFGIPSPPAIVLPSQGIIRLDIRDSERLQGFPVNWTKPDADVDRPSARWRLVGNAVTVPIATWIGRRISHPTPYDATQDELLSGNAPWPKAAWNRGQGRHRSQSTAWPVRSPPTPLARFLQFPGQPLSIRATSGLTSVSSFRPAMNGRLTIPDTIPSRWRVLSRNLAFDVPSPSAILASNGRATLNAFDVQGSSRTGSPSFRQTPRRLRQFPKL